MNIIIIIIVDVVNGKILQYKQKEIFPEEEVGLSESVPVQGGAQVCAAPLAGQV